jgi:dihydrofolate reductase
MKIKLIVAMDLDRGIGKNNDLMWHLPADMKFFKETTMNQIVVMGRKNYESIPEKFRPLPNRINVVLTRQKDFIAENCLIFHSLQECLKHFTNETEKTLFIIGGGQIYLESLESNLIDEMFVTHVDGQFDADTFFPQIVENEWNSEILFKHEMDEKNKFDFSVTKHIKKTNTF